MAIEIVNNSYVARFASASKKVSGLTRKAGNEIIWLAQNPNKLSVDRMKELGRNGEQWLRTINQQANPDLEDLERRFADTMRWHQDPSGVMVGYTSETPVAAVVFPVHSLATLYHPRRSDILPTTFASQALFVPTTHTLDKPVEAQYPSEGYKDTQTMLPFKPHSEEESPQFGGLFIDNQNHQLNVLTWEQTLERTSSPLLPWQILMAANMYMDSDNQEVVCNRPNLCDLFEVYNCIGTLREGQSSQYFTLNSHNFSFRKMLTGRNITLPTPSRQVTVWEMAALGNVIARKFKAKSWRQGYGEYSGGGTYFGITSKRYHLLINS